jgi:trehalose utilization protein
MALNVKNRQRVEREIATAVVKAAVAKGYTFIIDNGGDDDEHERTSTEEATLKAMFATDEDRLWVVDPKQPRPIGWVLFVYGNDGHDVICDYTAKPAIEELMVEADKIAKKYE